jgi:tetratricopeptide (TPR) repeat protein
VRARLHFVRGFFRGRVVEGEGVLDAERAATLFAEAGDRDGEGIALADLAFDATLAGEPDRALELAERAWLLTVDGDPWTHSWVENVRGGVLQDLGRDDESQAAYTQALSTLRELGDGFNVAIMELNLAEKANGAGDQGVARELATSALREGERLGTQLVVQYARTTLANVEVRARRYGEAAAWLRNSLADLPDPRGLAELLLVAAILAAATGRPDAAVRAWAAGERVRAGRWRPTPSLRPLADELLAPLRGELVGFDTAWAEGAAITPDEAFELARAIATDA